MNVRMIAYFIFLLLLLTACGTNDTVTGQTDHSEGKDTKEKNKQSAKPLSDSEFEKMYADPKKYKGAKVQFYAKIFVDPERDKDGTYLQAFLDGKNSERNIIIAIQDPNIDLKVDDIIYVKGEVKDEFEGENAFGAKIAAPVILADHVEKTDYITAFAQAYKTIDINEEQNQHGYKIIVKKMELAAEETRVYVKIDNTTDEKISFYTFNARLVEGNKQYDPISNYEADYTEVQSEILPGVSSEGIILFDKLENESGQVSLILEGSSDNYELNFKPFTFEIEY